MRYEYPNVFPKHYEHEQLEKEQGDTGKLKQLKINYQVNMLTSVNEANGTLMEALSYTDEMEIFALDSIIDLLEYKWGCFAKTFHKKNYYVHVLYIISILAYIQVVYLGTGKDLMDDPTPL